MSAEHTEGRAATPVAWSADAPASEADVLIVMRFADRAARKAVSEELAGTSLHTGQELVLAKLLHHGSLPVAQLAKVLDVEVPTATKTTQRMETAGLRNLLWTITTTLEPISSH